MKGKIKSALQKRLEEADDDDDDGMFEKPGSDKYSSDGEQDKTDKWEKTLGWGANNKSEQTWLYTQRNW